MQRTHAVILFAAVVSIAGCESTPEDEGGSGGAGGGSDGSSTLVVPEGTEVGDELVVTVRASSVAGAWDDASAPGAVLTITAGSNVPRDVVLVGGFAQETKASLGAWDGGDVTWTLTGDATFEGMDVSVDASAAGLPIVALMNDAYANDTPLLVYRNGDELEYVMTNEDGGTGLLPTLLLARWGRPHDIEALYDLADSTYQGPDHATLPFDGTLEGTHPKMRIATTNGLLSPEPSDSTARYHVSPVPVAFTAGDHIQRERVLDDLPWLVAAGWLEMAREGKIVASGGVEDSTLGELSAYVFVDFAFEGGVLAAFEVMVDGAWYSSLGIYADSSGGVLDARCSGTQRTAIELPEGKTIGDVTAVRVVPDEGAGTLVAARVLAYDPTTYELVVLGEIDAEVALDSASGSVDLDVH
ncbi:MAG: hypothetical protein HOW73_04065 [Polyangiaceae bacterium]|nr:hypothetical protein [Polyangiaceae bacterium]